MREVNRWGLAAGLAAALAYGNAHAQTTTSQTGSSSTTQSEKAAPGQGTGSTTTEQSATPSTERSTTATGTATGEQPKVKKTLANDLEKLHAMNQAEIHMGQMAEQQAQSSEVKDYGKMLSEDHQKLDEKLQSEASTLGVNLEGKEFDKAQKSSEKEMSKLQGKSGAAFDKEFMSRAVKDHANDQKAVQKAAKEARKEKQESLAMLFEGADKGIKSHLDEAKRIEKTVKQEGAKGHAAPESGTGSTGGSGSTSGGSSGSSSSDMGSSTGTTGKGSGSSATPH